MKLRVAFYALTGHRFDKGISGAFASGVLACGDDYIQPRLEEYTGTPDPNVDVAVFLGVKNNTRDVFRSYLAAGKAAVIWDKGYTRIRGGPLKTLYWRVSVNAFQPHHYLFNTPHDSERWERLGLKIKPMKPERKTGQGRILYCGGSQKYCDWHDLGDATKYAEWVLRKARKYTTRPLAYRPKPGWEEATPIPGVTYATGLFGTFGKELPGTYQVVVFGSNAAFEALINGVPATVLGDGIARSLANTSLRDLERPRLPSQDEVYKLASAAAYCQWTMEEMASGVAWEHVRTTVLQHKEGAYGPG